MNKIDNKKKKPVVSIIMGSQSDWKTLKYSEGILTKFGINFEKKNSFSS